MTIPAALALFVVTALAEILGCWLVWLWLRQQASPWWLLPAAASLATFAWLLTLHPTATGRVYAAYGGIYVVTAMVWLWLVDSVRPGRADLAGAALMLAGALTILWGHWPPPGGAASDADPDPGARVD